MNFLTTMLVPSPIGTLRIECGRSGLTGLFMAPHYLPLGESTPGQPMPDSTLEAAAEQIKQYFLGIRQDFDLPLAPEGTEFQQKCWHLLKEIPFGQTMSYGEMARRIGMPTASRAVGAANGRNPISVIIPCHRVIGADGSLVGFGGGIARKAALLEFERAVVFGEDPAQYWRFNPLDQTGQT